MGCFAAMAKPSNLMRILQIAEDRPDTPRAEANGELPQIGGRLRWTLPRRPRSSWTLPRGSRTGHARPLTTLQTLEESVRLQRALTRSRTSATTRSSWASPSRDRSPRSALQSWSQTQAPEDSYRSAAPLYSRKPAARLSSAEACRGDSAIGRSGRVHGLRDEVRPRPPAEDETEVLTEAMMKMQASPNPGSCRA